MMINNRNVKLFDSMYDYVEDADFGYYQIADGKERETPFVESVQPQDDSNFMIFAEDHIHYEGNNYTKVNFGEDDSEQESFLLDSALEENVFLIYNQQAIVCKNVFLAHNQQAVVCKNVFLLHNRQAVLCKNVFLATNLWTVVFKIYFSLTIY